MKKFKTFIKEAARLATSALHTNQGTVNQVVWNSATQGQALMTIPAEQFDKDQDASSLKILKSKVPTAKVLTKLKKDANPIQKAGGPSAGKYYLVNVEFSTIKESQDIILTKAHNKRTLVSTGKEVGAMIGYIDVIADVSIDNPQAPAIDRFYAYGIKGSTTLRLGNFDTQAKAIEAIKKASKKS